jgi:ferredoxin
MHVTVDDSVCQGHTLCNLAAPEVFKLRDDDGHAYAETSLVDPAIEEAVRNAELTCPERAVRISAQAGKVGGDDGAPRSVQP